MNMTNDWLTTYKDGSGNYIPASHFENEPSRPPRPLSTILSAEGLIEFFLMTITIRTAAEKIRAGRVLH